MATRWVVHEVVDRRERFLLVEGRVDKGAEADPPAEAEYVVLREITSAEASASRLPVHTLRIPHFYTLPESFTVKVIVQTEPAGGKVYQALTGGALVALGTAPATITLTGSISDQRVVLTSEAWIGETAPSGELAMDLWATAAKLATSTSGRATPVAVLLPADVSALRSGKRSLEKHVILSLREPLTAETQNRLHLTLTLDGPAR